MKRSLMVLKIAECLIEPHHEDILKEASDILKRLENAGMLPPKIKGYIASSVSGDGHKWELEDEDEFPRSGAV